MLSDTNGQKTFVSLLLSFNTHAYLDACATLQSSHGPIELLRLMPSLGNGFGVRMYGWKVKKTSSSLCLSVHAFSACYLALYMAPQAETGVCRGFQPS